MNDSNEHELDLLTGCGAIATYLKWPERRVYNVVRNGYLPIKKVGGLLVARKSELLKALSAQA
jgi:hypothetical protein